MDINSNINSNKIVNRIGILFIVKSVLKKQWDNIPFKTYEYTTTKIHHIY